MFSLNDLVQEKGKRSPSDDRRQPAYKVRRQSDYGYVIDVNTLPPGTPLTIEEFKRLKAQKS